MEQVLFSSPIREEAVVAGRSSHGVEEATGDGWIWPAQIACTAFFLGCNGGRFLTLCSLSGDLRQLARPCCPHYIDG